MIEHGLFKWRSQANSLVLKYMNSKANGEVELNFNQELSKTLIANVLRLQDIRILYSVSIIGLILSLLTIMAEKFLYFKTKKRHDE